MKPSFRLLTRGANLTGFWASELLHRAVGSRFHGRPADFQVDVEEVHRMEGHWALTFSHRNTVRFPPARLRQLGGFLDTASYLRVLWQSRRTTDAQTIRIQPETAPNPPGGRSIRVSDDYYTTPGGGNVLHYPYVMHPWLYALGQYKRLGKLRRTPRRFRLFFSGAINETYQDYFKFPMMSRLAIVECLLDTFRREICLVSTPADLAELPRTDRPIVMVLFRGEVIASGVHHVLARDKYVQLLAQSQFALCPPGCQMPHSHNLIEAMAVGTIPITNYAAYCRPPLTDGQDCLAFSTPDELCSAVRRALAAPPAEVQAMQAATTRYYDDELSPAGFARKLDAWFAQPRPEYRLILNQEGVTARLWEQSAARGGSQHALAKAEGPV